MARIGSQKEQRIYKEILRAHQERLTIEKRTMKALRKNNYQIYSLDG